ncbi:flagellar protein FlaG [Aliikangiella marina]|uniref:Flagellar protein FlaG n=1 Tax=Aliikangiella marina TaxID=1712262 RepID=A0A545TDL7_9GAMM|nr:flagellar protein FlaG [Aliikangiella marina]TQV75317.1 flagellar protein FlaG [Aliikangiella marina]
MAIEELSGNFQPVLRDNGKSLLSLANAQPSTSDIDRSNDSTVVEIAQQPVNRNAKADSNTRQLEEAKTEIEDLQEFNQQISRSLQFRVDDELGVTVVKVVDKATDELIRQFPPEELLNLSRRLKDLSEEGILASGVLLQEKA